MPDMLVIITNGILTRIKSQGLESRDMRIVVELSKYNDDASIDSKQGDAKKSLASLLDVLYTVAKAEARKEIDFPQQKQTPRPPSNAPPRTDAARTRTPLNNLMCFDCGGTTHKTNDIICRCKGQPNMRGLALKKQYYDKKDAARASMGEVKPRQGSPGPKPHATAAAAGQKEKPPFKKKEAIPDSDWKTQNARRQTTNSTVNPDWKATTRIPMLSFDED